MLRLLQQVPPSPLLLPRVPASPLAQAQGRVQPDLQAERGQRREAAAGEGELGRRVEGRDGRRRCGVRDLPRRTVGAGVSAAAVQARVPPVVLARAAQVWRERRVPGVPRTAAGGAGGNVRRGGDAAGGIGGDRGCAASAAAVRGGGHPAAAGAC